MSTPILQASVVRCPTCNGSGVVTRHTQAEIDRLRAENESLHQQLDTVSEAHNVMAKEGDRLRAENAMARVFFQAILDSGQRGYSADLAIEFLAKTAKTAKEGE